VESVRLANLYVEVMFSQTVMEGLFQCFVYLTLNFAYGSESCLYATGKAVTYHYW